MHHVDHGLPCRRDESNVEGAEPLAGLDQCLIERNVLADWSHVPAGGNRLLHQRTRFVDRHLLAHDNSIEAVRYWRARINHFEVRSGKQRGRTVRIARAHGNAIHRRNPQRWRGTQRTDCLCRNASNCLAHRYALGSEWCHKARLDQRLVPAPACLDWVWVATHDSTEMRCVWE